MSFVTSADDPPYLPPQSTLIHQTPRFSLYEVDLSENNRKFLVYHPGAVLIVPCIDNDNIVMIRNERFAVGETLWELPAGTKEPGEPSIETAARELIEETGYRAKSIQPMLSFYTTPGICNERMDVFLAKDLSFQGQDLDEHEKIQVEIMPIKRCIEMIKEGSIRDGKTIAALLYFEAVKK